MAATGRNAAATAVAVSADVVFALTIVAVILAILAIVVVVVVLLPSLL